MKKTTTVRKWLGLTILGMTTITSLQFINSALAGSSPFSETPLDQEKVIAIASPFGENHYNLLVIEQIPGKKQCWSENGSNPVVVDPLLLKFDFTGSCRRSTDSNGYSVRINGEDYGLDLLLGIVVKDNELVLVATNRKTSEEIVIGRTKGLVAGGFLKIQLDPGWSFTKRTYKGKLLGHFYFSKSGEISNPEPTTRPSPDVEKK